jgi:hypothetical protein
MVLVANTSSSNSGDKRSLESSGLQAHNSIIGENNSHLHQHEISEVSDILMAPKLVVNNNEGARSKGIQNQNVGPSVAPLRGIQQAAILAQCLLIEKSSRNDEMQSEFLTQTFGSNMSLIFGSNMSKDFFTRVPFTLFLF